MKDEYDFSEGQPGAIFPPATGKTRITIRIDDEILDWFREAANRQGGGSYQTMINAALRRFISGIDTEETLRRLLREELDRAAARASSRTDP